MQPGSGGTVYLAKLLNPILQDPKESSKKVRKDGGRVIKQKSKQDVSDKIDNSLMEFDERETRESDR